MKALIIYLIMGLGCIFASAVYADIYQWTDENGVQHFTNYAPRDGARLIAKTRELPFDEAADRARREADRQYLLELSRQESAQREVERQQREAQAQRRLIEAEQKAREKLQQAEDLLTAARQIADSCSSHGGYIYSGYAYPCYGYPSWCRPYDPYRPPHIQPINRRMHRTAYSQGHCSRNASRVHRSGFYRSRTGSLVSAGIRVGLRHR